MIPSANELFGAFSGSTEREVLAPQVHSKLNHCLGPQGEKLSENETNRWRRQQLLGQHLNPEQAFSKPSSGLFLHSDHSYRTLFCAKCHSAAGDAARNETLPISQRPRTCPRAFALAVRSAWNALPLTSLSIASSCTCQV